MSSQHPTSAAFRAAIERGDHQAAVALLAEDVVFHSPIVHRTYQGHVLAFSCRVGGRDLSGVDIFRFGDDGSIAEFTVMVRPYSAATALREQMAALLA